MLAALTSERASRIDERAQALDGSDAPPAQPAGMHTAAAAAAAPTFAAAPPAAVDRAGTPMPSVERIVEQVSWWLSQKIQGADFSIDIPGGPPLSVSVQIRGSEAQVAFRSDQPELRQLLGQAMSMLRDSFSGEGLLLSQASIGTHAEGQGPHSGDAQQRHWRAPQPDARRADPLEPAALATVPGRRVPSGSGRGSLDLYV